MNSRAIWLKVQCNWWISRSGDAEKQRILTFGHHKLPRKHKSAIVIMLNDQEAHGAVSGSILSSNLFIYFFFLYSFR